MACLRRIFDRLVVFPSMFPEPTLHLRDLLNYVKSLAGQRNCLSDYAVLLFDDKFRRYAAAECGDLSDFKSWPAISAHYFNSEFRRKPKFRPYNNIPRYGEGGGNQDANCEPPFRIRVVIRDYNRSRCTRPNCQYKHQCGHCGRGAHAQLLSCLRRKQCLVEN